MERTEIERGERYHAIKISAGAVVYDEHRRDFIRDEDGAIIAFHIRNVEDWKKFLNWLKQEEAGNESEKEKKNV